MRNIKWLGRLAHACSVFAGTAAVTATVTGAAAVAETVFTAFTLLRGRPPARHNGGVVDYTSLHAENARKLRKALAHLKYSFDKVSRLPVDPTTLDEEALETWESFAARFARVADLFLSRYVKTYVLRDDPGFEGTLRDFANQAEKLGLLDNVDAWLRIRELRNISAHEYSESDIEPFFRRLRDEAPRLLALEAVIP